MGLVPSKLGLLEQQNKLPELLSQYGAWKETGATGDAVQAASTTETSMGLGSKPWPLEQQNKLLEPLSLVWGLEENLVH